MSLAEEEVREQYVEKRGITIRTEETVRQRNGKKRKKKARIVEKWFFSLLEVRESLGSLGGRMRSSKIVLALIAFFFLEIKKRENFMKMFVLRFSYDSKGIW